MEIKYNKDFSKFGEVSTIGDDTIVIKKYSIEDDMPIITTTQGNTFYKEVSCLYINATAPKKRDLIFLFSVSRTSANIYKTFIYLSTFADYNTFSSMKAVVEYLENFFKINRK